MKILSVSDKVEKELLTSSPACLPARPDCILACGDLPPEYLSFLAAAFNIPLFYVLGNHDIRYDLKPPDGCIDLHAKLVKFQGINILGLEGSIWYNGGPHQYTEGQMRKTIRGLRSKIWRQKGVDIIITHAPPRHIHDAEDQCHKGFEVYQWLIDHYSPGYFIHGHIHVNFTDTSQRISIVKETKVINTFGYHLFEIDDDRIAK